LRGQGQLFDDWQAYFADSIAVSIANVMTAEKIKQHLKKAIFTLVNEP
jgi:hypothetical protein